MKEHSVSFQYSVLELSELPTDVVTLIGHARKARKAAYAPYSEFLVGAALKLDSGDIVTGSNQENASFPAGLCAERVAAHQAMAVHPNARIEALAIVAGKKGSTQGAAVAPCGICRQSLLEYERVQDFPIMVYCVSLSGKVIRVSGISSLLPLSFGREDL